ncbi:hypothetical protein BX265_6877 [Streptomyces sp. TLI_235]|nr:hypothetical protein [Streptomyces sp. TLI_235]PBC69548.1 hypothetical protein BX265_6877 [Streptomyces sp. TLI_235]
MTLSIPPELRSVSKFLVGVWPSGDEDRLWALAGTYRGLARDAAALQNTLAALSPHVPGWRGDARAEHDRGVGRVLGDSGLNRLRDSALEMAQAVDEAGTQTEKAKIQDLEIGFWLASSIVWAVGTAWLTGVTSLSLLASIKAAAERMLLLSRQALLEALSLLGQGVRAAVPTLVKAAVGGAGFMAAADLVAQEIEVFRGHQEHIDVVNTLAAAGVGAAAGVVGLGVGVGRQAAADLARTVGKRALGDVELAVLSTPSVLRRAAGQADRYGQMVGTNLITNGMVSSAQGESNWSAQEAVAGAGATLMHGPVGPHTVRPHTPAGPHGSAGSHGPTRALEALPHLGKETGAERFQPFGSEPDAGGFTLSNGERVEVTKGGDWWVRPAEWGGEGAGESAFAQAVRSRPADARPRLLVGTPDTPSGDGLKTLVAAWEEVRHRPDAPTRLALALPLRQAEVPALQEFVAREGISVDVPNGRVLAGPEGMLYVPDGGSERGQWHPYAPPTTDTHLRAAPGGASLDPPRWERALLAIADPGTGLPPGLADSLRPLGIHPSRIPGGILLHQIPEHVAADSPAAGHTDPAARALPPTPLAAARSLAPDPARLTILAADKHSASALHTVVTGLPPEARQSLRLVTPDGGGRHAVDLLSKAPGVDEVLATNGPTSLPETGYAHARNHLVHDAESGHTEPVEGSWLKIGRSQEPAAPGAHTPRLVVEPVGALYPSPGWDQAVTEMMRHRDMLPVDGRVPAGLVLDHPDTTAAPTFDAAQLLPDPQRLTVAVHGSPHDPQVRARVETLVENLSSLPATRSVRLAWDRAAHGEGADFLQSLADRHQVELLAPTGRITLLEGGAHQVENGQWMRLAESVPPRLEGALFPPPAWSDAADRAVRSWPTVPFGEQLRRIAAGVVLEDIPEQHVVPAAPDYRPATVRPSESPRPSVDGPVGLVRTDPTGPAFSRTLDRLVGALADGTGTVRLVLSHPRAERLLTDNHGALVGRVENELRRLAGSHGVHLRVAEGAWTPTSDGDWQPVGHDPSASPYHGDGPTWRDYLPDEFQERFGHPAGEHTAETPHPVPDNHEAVTSDLAPHDPAHRRAPADLPEGIDPEHLPALLELHDKAEPVTSETLRALVGRVLDLPAHEPVPNLSAFAATVEAARFHAGGTYPMTIEQLRAYSAHLTGHDPAPGQVREAMLLHRVYSQLVPGGDNVADTAGLHALQQGIDLAGEAGRRLEDPQSVLDHLRGLSRQIAADNPAAAWSGETADLGSVVATVDLAGRLGFGRPTVDQLLVTDRIAWLVANHKSLAGWANFPHQRPALRADGPILRRADGVDIARVEAATLDIFGHPRVSTLVDAYLRARAADPDIGYSRTRFTDFLNLENLVRERLGRPFGLPPTVQEMADFAAARSIARWGAETNNSPSVSEWLDQLGRPHGDRYRWGQLTVEPWPDNLPTVDLDEIWQIAHEADLQGRAILGLSLGLFRTSPETWDNLGLLSSHLRDTHQEHSLGGPELKRAVKGLLAELPALAGTSRLTGRRGKWNWRAVGVDLLTVLELHTPDTSVVPASVRQVLTDLLGVEAAEIRRTDLTGMARLAEAARAREGSTDRLTPAAVRDYAAFALPWVPAEEQVRRAATAHRLYDLAFINGALFRIPWEASSTPAQETGIALSRLRAIDVLHEMSSRYRLGLLEAGANGRRAGSAEFLAARLPRSGPLFPGATETRGALAVAAESVRIASETGFDRAELLELPELLAWARQAAPGPGWTTERLWAFYTLERATAGPDGEGAAAYAARILDLPDRGQALTRLLDAMERHTPDTLLRAARAAEDMVRQERRSAGLDPQEPVQAAELTAVAHEIRAGRGGQDTAAGAPQEWVEGLLDTLVLADGLGASGRGIAEIREVDRFARLIRPTVDGSLMPDQPLTPDRLVRVQGSDPVSARDLFDAYRKLQAYDAEAQPAVGRLLALHAFEDVLTEIPGHLEGFQTLASGTIAPPDSDRAAMAAWLDAVQILPPAERPTVLLDLALGGLADEVRAGLGHETATLTDIRAHAGTILDRPPAPGIVRDLIEARELYREVHGDPRASSANKAVGRLRDLAHLAGLARAEGIPTSEGRITAEGLAELGRRLNTVTSDETGAVGAARDLLDTLHLAGRLGRFHPDAATLGAVAETARLVGESIGGVRPPRPAEIDLEDVARLGEQVVGHHRTIGGLLDTVALARHLNPAGTDLATVRAAAALLAIAPEHLVDAAVDTSTVTRQRLHDLAQEILGRPDPRDLLDVYQELRQAAPGIAVTRERLADFHRLTETADDMVGRWGRRSPVEWQVLAATLPDLPATHRLPEPGLTDTGEPAVSALLGAMAAHLPGHRALFLRTVGQPPIAEVRAHLDTLPGHRRSDLLELTAPLIHTPAIPDDAHLEPAARARALRHNLHLRIASALEQHGHQVALDLADRLTGNPSRHGAEDTAEVQWQREMARPLRDRMTEAEFRVLLSQASALVQHDLVVGHEETAVQRRLTHWQQLLHVAEALYGSGDGSDRAAAHGIATDLGIQRRTGLPGGSWHGATSWTYNGDDPAEAAAASNTDVSRVEPRPRWRTDNRTLYRAAAAEPENVFEYGFQPDKADNQHTFEDGSSSNVSLNDYVSYGHGRTSMYVSTTRRREFAEQFDGEGRRHVYAIDAPGGVDVNATLGGWHAYRHEDEVAFPGGVHRRHVVGAWEAPGRESSEYRANPNYEERQRRDTPPPDESEEEEVDPYGAWNNYQQHGGGSDTESVKSESSSIGGGGFYTWS